MDSSDRLRTAVRRVVPPTRPGRWHRLNCGAGPAWSREGGDAASERLVFLAARLSLRDTPGFWSWVSWVTCRPWGRDLSVSSKEVEVDGNAGPGAPAKEFNSSLPQPLRQGDAKPVEACIRDGRDRAPDQDDQASSGQEARQPSAHVNRRSDRIARAPNGVPERAMTAPTRPPPTAGSRRRYGVPHESRMWSLHRVRRENVPARSVL